MKPNRKSIPLQIALIVVLFATLACRVFSATPTPSMDLLSTMVASTLQAYQAQGSPTLPPTTVPPVNVPVTVISPTLPAPLPTPTTGITLPAAARLQFATGSTKVVTTGTLQAGQTISYVVKALKDQPVIATADSPNQDLKLSIFGANGVLLLPTAQGSSSWQGTLPSTQDYYFQITGGASTENFTLNVVIAARIQFDAGTTRTILKGQTVNGYAVTYVAYAQKGQKMNLTLNVPGDSAALTVWGFSDGQPYARAQTGIQDFSLNLPSTQDYIIEVVPQADQVVDYSLTVKIK